MSACGGAGVGGVDGEVVVVGGGVVDVDVIVVHDVFEGDVMLLAHATLMLVIHVVALLVVYVALMMAMSLVCVCS